MNLLSDTENAIVIPCLKEHLLPKMPCLSCQEPSHQFQARNCRESTCYPQPKCDNITNLQPTDWPDSTKQYFHIYTWHYLRVWAVEPVCNFPHIKQVVPKAQTQDIAKTDGEGHWKQNTLLQVQNSSNHGYYPVPFY